MVNSSCVGSPGMIVISTSCVTGARPLANDVTVTRHRPTGNVSVSANWPPVTVTSVDGATGAGDADGSGDAPGSGVGAIDGAGVPPGSARYVPAMVIRVPV